MSFSISMAQLLAVRVKAGITTAEEELAKFNQTPGPNYDAALDAVLLVWDDFVRLQEQLRDAKDKVDND